MTPILAELPSDLALYIVLACVGVAIMCLVGIAALLKFVAGLRHSLAAELKRDLAPADPTLVEIQQPLDVRKHNPCASADELTDVHGRLKRERGELDARIAEVKAEAASRMDKLEKRLEDSITNLSAQLAGNDKASEARVGALHNRINDVLAAVSELKGRVAAKANHES